MTKAQITIRLSTTLIDELNQYVEQIGTSKTDVVVNAIAQYLSCAESMLLSQRLAEWERRMAAVETKIEAK